MYSASTSRSTRRCRSAATRRSATTRQYQRRRSEESGEFDRVALLARLGRRREAASPRRRQSFQDQQRLRRLARSPRSMPGPAAIPRPAATAEILGAAGGEVPARCCAILPGDPAYLPVGGQRLEAAGTPSLGHRHPAAASTASRRSPSRSREPTANCLETAIPKVSIVKDAGARSGRRIKSDPAQEVDVPAAFIDYKLKARTAIHGLRPRRAQSLRQGSGYVETRALLRAVYTGFPVVNVGRGNTEGFAIRGAARSSPASQPERRPRRASC